MKIHRKFRTEAYVEIELDEQEFEDIKNQLRAASISVEPDFQHRLYFKNVYIVSKPLTAVNILEDIGL